MPYTIVFIHTQFFWSLLSHQKNLTVGSIQSYRICIVDFFTMALPFFPSWTHLFSSNFYHWFKMSIPLQKSNTHFLVGQSPLCGFLSNAHSHTTNQPPSTTKSFRAATRCIWFWFNICREPPKMGIWPEPPINTVSWLILTLARKDAIVFGCRNPKRQLTQRDVTIRSWLWLCCGSQQLWPNLQTGRQVASNLWILVCDQCQAIYKTPPMFHA